MDERIDRPPDFFEYIQRIFNKFKKLKRSEQQLLRRNTEKCIAFLYSIKRPTKSFCKNMKKANTNWRAYAKNDNNVVKLCPLNNKYLPINCKTELAPQDEINILCQKEVVITRLDDSVKSNIKILMSQLRELPELIHRLMFKEMSFYKISLLPSFNIQFNSFFSNKLRTNSTYKKHINKFAAFINLTPNHDIIELLIENKIKWYRLNNFLVNCGCSQYAISSICSYYQAFKHEFRLRNLKKMFEEQTDNTLRALRKCFDSYNEGCDIMSAKQAKQLINIAKTLTEEGKTQRGFHLILRFTIIFLLRNIEVVNMLKEDIFPGLYPCIDGIEREGVKICTFESKSFQSGDPQQTTTITNRTDKFWCPSEILKEVNNVFNNDSEFLFHKENGDAIEAYKIYEDFQKVKQEFLKDEKNKEEFSNKNLRFHSLRATMMCLLFQWGCEPVQIQSLARHKRLTSTFYYLLKTKGKGIAFIKRIKSLKETIKELKITCKETQIKIRDEYKSIDQFESAEEIMKLCNPGEELIEIILPEIIEPTNTPKITVKNNKTEPKGNKLKKKQVSKKIKKPKRNKKIRMHGDKVIPEGVGLVTKKGTWRYWVQLKTGSMTARGNFKDMETALEAREKWITENQDQI